MRAICKNEACPRSYASHNGKLLVGLINVLRNDDLEGRERSGQIIKRIKELAPIIYQASPECSKGPIGQHPMAMVPAPAEPNEMNTLLENIELLEIYEAL